MAFLGRPSPNDERRAQRFKAWFDARSPYAVASAPLGLLAAIDSFTGVLGLILGVAAIVMGVRGLRDLKANPQRLGRGLCLVGIVLGAVGIAAGLLVWTIL